MSFDVLIRGATVVGAGVQRRLDVGVADGLIAALGPELAGPATEEIDAAGLHLIARGRRRARALQRARSRRLGGL